MEEAKSACAAAQRSYDDKVNDYKRDLRSSDAGKREHALNELRGFGPGTQCIQARFQRPGARAWSPWPSHPQDRVRQSLREFKERLDKTDSSWFEFPSMLD